MTNREAAAPREKSLVEKEAVAWFTRMNGKPSRAERRDFTRWLNASPHHEQAYVEVCSLWSDLGATADTIGRQNADDLTGPLLKIERHRRQNRTGKAGAIVAGCLAVVLAWSWLWLEHPNLVQNLSADHVTARAERRIVTLADGSIVMLDADSALDSIITADERRIRLLRGAASFTVRSSDVPFIVEAENGEARVLGTTFDVALATGGNVTVTLSGGSVEVSLLDRAQKVVLQPGESVDYGRSGLGAVRSVDLEESMAWHRGRFIFNNARLADVLAQIGRYHSGRIVLIGSALGERRVSGNISLENTNAALAAVQLSLGFRMTSLGGKVTVIGP